MGLSLPLFDKNSTPNGDGCVPTPKSCVPTPKGCIPTPNEQETENKAPNGTKKKPKTLT